MESQPDDSHLIEAARFGDLEALEVLVVIDSVRSTAACRLQRRCESRSIFTPSEMRHSARRASRS